MTAQYLQKYMAMDVFLDLVRQDLVKMRIMFTQNINVPTGLDSFQRANGYHLLYYQFIKHAFGLANCNCQIHPRFNIGISTGQRGDSTYRWQQSYRHWLFIPAEYLRDKTQKKAN